MLRCNWVLLALRLQGNLQDRTFEGEISWQRQSLEMVAV